MSEVIYGSQESFVGHTDLGDIATQSEVSFDSNLGGQVTEIDFNSGLFED